MTTRRRLEVYDLITLGVFSSLYTLVLTFISAAMSVVPVAFVFFAAVSAFPCGIIYAYITAKIPKPGAILILSSALAFAFLGTYGASPFVLAGGLLADIISSTRRHRSFFANALGYVVFTIATWLGFVAPMILATENYVHSLSAQGYAGDSVRVMIDFITGPMFFVTLGVSVAGALLGIRYGRRVLEKHFVRSGIL
ncbi:MAG: MptD family putative ECF transporter S component [Pseudodesulfovibrio sp.]